MSKILYHLILIETDPAIAFTNFPTEVTIQDSNGNDVVAKPLMDYKNFISGGSQTLDPATSGLNISSIKCQVNNKDEEVSKALYSIIDESDKRYYRVKARVYGLSKDGSPTLIFTGVLKGHDNDPLETYYSFNITDYFDLFKKALWKRELSEYFRDRLETISDINQHRLPYWMEDTTRKGFTMIERAIDPSEPDGEKERVITAVGHPVDLLKGMYQMILSIPEIEIGEPLLGDDWKDYVDEAALEELRDEIGPEYEFYNEWTEAIDSPLQLIKEEFYQTIGCYPLLTPEGKIRLKVHRQPIQDEIDSSIELWQGNIQSIGKVRTEFEKLVNQMQAEYHYDFSDDKFMVKKYFFEEGSWRKHGDFFPDKADNLELKTLNNMDAVQQETYVNLIRDRKFSRFSDSFKLIDVTVELSSLIRAGDYVLFSHPEVIEWEGERKGERGIERGGIDIGPEDITAHLNDGDEWAGYIEGTTINRYTSHKGESILVVDIDMEIQHDFFNSSSSEYFSCLDNHNRIRDWIANELR